MKGLYLYIYVYKSIILCSFLENKQGHNVGHSQLRHHSTNPPQPVLYTMILLALK